MLYIFQIIRMAFERVSIKNFIYYFLLKFKIKFSIRQFSYNIKQNLICFVVKLTSKQLTSQKQLEINKNINTDRKYGKEILIIKAEFMFS